MPSYAGHYADSVTRGEARERLGLPAAARVFLCFGYVKPYKGIDDLIRAFRELGDAQAVLLIVGTPLNRAIADELAALAAGDDRIRLDLRYVGDEEIQVFFRAADIAVFPFKHTHSSSSIMLAMTFGCPMIAPAIASIPEYVDVNMAELFDPGQPDSLAMALQKASRRDLRAMGEAARRHAANFRWSDMADAHASTYRRIAGREAATGGGSARRHD
jgi:glycosyltransferase involved in cell wall biosynthesis